MAKKISLRTNKKAVSGKGSTPEKAETFKRGESETPLEIPLTKVKGRSTREESETSRDPSSKIRKPKK